MFISENSLPERGNLK